MDGPAKPTGGRTTLGKAFKTSSGRERMQVDGHVDTHVHTLGWSMRFVFPCNNGWTGSKANSVIVLKLRPQSQ